MSRNSARRRPGAMQSSPTWTKRGPGRRPAHKKPSRPGTKLRRLAREGGLA